MKVILVSPDSINQAHGGIGRLLAALVRRLETRGFEFVAVVPKSTLNSKVGGGMNDAVVREIPVGALRREQVDSHGSETLLHIHYPLFHPELALATNIPIPRVSTFHTTALGEAMSLKGVPPEWFTSNDWLFLASLPFQYAAEALARRSSSVIGVSESIVEEMKANHPSSAGWPWKVIPNGVDTALYSPNKEAGTAGRPILLFTGRHGARKGLFDLLAAFEILRFHKSRPKLVITGQASPSTARAIRAAAKGLAEDDIVTTGFVNHQALVDLYGRSAVFVFPSRYEGCPLSILEAMSTGCPVVSYRLPSIQEIFRGNGGGAVLV